MLLLFFPKRMRERLNQHASMVWLINLLGLLLFSSVIFVVGFKFAENVSWGEAGWQMWQTITTIGYGNCPAQKNCGRIITIIFGTFGLAILGASITAVFDFKADRESRRRSGLMSNAFKNGYVVFHMPVYFETFVRELRNVESNVPICVVDNKLEELPSSIRAIGDIHFVRASLTDPATFEKAGIQNSKAVIVFPSDSGNPESDAGTSVIVELVARFANPGTKIMHIMVDEANAVLFQGKPSIPINECLEALAVVQECQDPYSAPLIQKLLSNREGANPETIVPARIVGWTWMDLCQIAPLAARAVGMSANPLALIHNGIPEPCPSPDSVIEEGDLISIVVFKGFDWERFEQELVHQRSKRNSAESVAIPK